MAEGCIKRHDERRQAGKKCPGPLGKLTVTQLNSSCSKKEQNWHCRKSNQYYERILRSSSGMQATGQNDGVEREDNENGSLRTGYNLRIIVLSQE